MYKIALIIFCSTTVFALSEKAVVLLALDKSPDIKIQRITLKKDSLELRSVQSDAGIQVLLSGNRLIEFHPQTMKKYTATGTAGQAVEVDTTEKELSGSLDGTVSRYVPGGGTVNLSLDNSFTNDFGGEGTDYTTTASLDFTQPLLKNAWGNADIDYFIKLEQNNVRISREQFKNDIREIISDIREKYWDWVLAAKTVSIRQTQLQYAENEMSYERTRFIIGEGTEMDTLSAALELLRARENLMTADYEEKTTRKNLCLELDIPADSLAFSIEPVIALEPLPEPDIILQSAKKNSKDLNVLELTHSSLILQEKKESNKLLPNVDLEAGIRNTRYGTQLFNDDNGTSAQPSQFDPYIGIRFTYNILARSEKLSKKKTALNLVSSEIEREQILREIRIDVENFIDAWHRDSARLAIRGKEITIAEKTYAQAVEGYKIGTVDNLERLKAKNDLINSKLNRLNAEINLKKLEIAVDNATATTLKRFGVNLK